MLLVVGLDLNVSSHMGLINTGGMVALLLFVIGSLAIGLVLGGREADTRCVPGPGTTQCNVLAAIMVNAQNFSSTNTLSLMPTTCQLGARAQAPAALAARTQS
jgi:hypothetical protein